MSSKKIIVNPEFLKVKKQKTGASNSKTLKRREKQSSNREKAKMHSLKPKTLKRNLLHKIKQYQKKREISDKEVSEKEELPKDTRDSFEDALKTLQDIINKNKREKQRTKKQHHNNPSMSNNILLTPKLVTHEDGKIFEKQNGGQKMLLKPDPPYGCLKNGRKKTFRQYHKSIKQPKFIESQTPLKVEPIQQNLQNQNNSHVSSKSIIKPYIFNTEQMRDSISLRKNKLQMAKDKLNIVSNKPNKRERIKRIIKKTRRKYNLGKKDGKVNILIKDGDTRKKIKQEIKSLDNTPLRELKQNLKKKNLIKIGSSAPEYILRDIYKNSILIGDIQNTNSSVVLKNYLSELTS